MKMKKSKSRTKSINSNKSHQIVVNDFNQFCKIDIIKSSINNHQNGSLSLWSNKEKAKHQKQQNKELKSKQIPWKYSITLSDFQIEEFQSKLTHIQRKVFYEQTRIKSLKLRDTKGYLQAARKKKEQSKKNDFKGADNDHKTAKEQKEISDYFEFIKYFLICKHASIHQKQSLNQFLKNLEEKLK